MTIRVTLDEFEEQFQEAAEEKLQWDTSDELDITYKFNARFSQGWSRKIRLRDGIVLCIDRHQPADHLLIDDPVGEENRIWCNFTLSGKGQLITPSGETLFPRTAGKYMLCGTGLYPQSIIDESDIEPYCHLFIHIYQSVLRSFASSPDGELPTNLQHLIKTLSQDVYRRGGDITPEMNTVLQRILNCTYQGIIKRAFLESKVIELMSLVLDHEVAIQQGEVKKFSLKPEQIERIHYAKEILLQDLSNPPSLGELARQAGLNDFLLKQGFHQVFNTTVFGELRSHRLEIAKQLLAEQDISIADAGYRVGYASLASFSQAFKRKFGISPKAYQKACR
ncbi:MAG: AraC family transcriptional regulator [Cyanobacteria bacterium P01_G01_bin.49]